MKVTRGSQPMEIWGQDLYCGEGGAVTQVRGPGESLTQNGEGALFPWAAWMAAETVQTCQCSAWLSRGLCVVMAGSAGWVGRGAEERVY